MPRQDRQVYLHQHHGRNFLGSESLGLSQVVDLHGGVSTLVDDLERPRFNILLDNRILIPPTDETPTTSQNLMKRRKVRVENAVSYLMSKTVFIGFIAAWFLAASPIKRSLSVKDTNEGVV